MKGGKREGAGRPPAPPSAVIRIRVRVDQHKAIQELGGDVWLKRVISDALFLTYSENDLNKNTTASN